MAVKHISEIIGDFGKWQLNIAAFYFTIYILSPFNNFGITFHAPKVDYRCTNYSTQYDSYFKVNSTELIDRCSHQELCQNWEFNETLGKTIVSEVSPLLLNELTLN